MAVMKIDKFNISRLTGEANASTNLNCFKRLNRLMGLYGTLCYLIRNIPGSYPTMLTNFPNSCQWEVKKRNLQRVLMQKPYLRYMGVSCGHLVTIWYIALIEIF